MSLGFPLNPMSLLHNPLISQVVLGVMAIVLLSGSAGLLLIGWSSPLLRGLLWVSGSFLLGGVSTLLVSVEAYVPLGLSDGLANLLMLSSFVSLDLAVCEVHGKQTRIPRLSLCLLALQVTLSTVTLSVDGADRLHLLGASVLLAIQACFSGWALLRHRAETAWAPAILCGCLFFAYGGLRMARAFALMPHVDLGQRAALETSFSVALLAVILGIAFGFFWITTSVFARGLEQIAGTDPLTRIYNRRTFLLLCEKELDRSLEAGSPFSLLMLDLDHFKRVNDSFGHPVGDRLLCAVVERIQDGVRGVDLLGRWGGEEFAVLLPRASAGAAFLVAERVRGNIERSSMPLSEAEGRGHSRQLRATASLGSATFRGPGDSLDALFRRADAALYAAKRQGRNCTVASTRSTDGPEIASATHAVPDTAETLPALLQEPVSAAPELLV